MSLGLLIQAVNNRSMLYVAVGYLLLVRSTEIVKVMHVFELAELVMSAECHVELTVLLL